MHTYFSYVDMCVLREVCIHNFHLILGKKKTNPAVLHRNHVIQRPSSFAPVVKDNSKEGKISGRNSGLLNKAHKKRRCECICTLNL